MFHKSVFLCQTSFSFSEGDISVVILYEKKHYYFAILQFYMVFPAALPNNRKKIILG